MFKALAMALTIATTVTATAVPIHAEETSRVVPHYTVGENGVTKNGDAYFDGNGDMIKNAFLADGAYTYFLQNDGTAMKDRLTYHPNGVSIIYFDENGHEVFDNFVNVKHSIEGNPVDDLCYFNTFGEMYVDVVTYDKTGTNLYYANACGVVERNGWFTYSNLQGGGTGFANADGTLLKDTYAYDANGNYVYMEGDGSVRNSRTCAKHEHNWKPHYTNCINTEAYDEIVVVPNTEKKTMHVEETQYMMPKESADKVVEFSEKNPTSSPYSNEYLSKVKDFVENQLIAENKAVNITEIAQNATPEERKVYEDYWKAINGAEDATLIRKITEYFKNQGWKYRLTMQEFEYTPAQIEKTIHHAVGAEQVINYYYCDSCGHTSMTK